MYTMTHELVGEMLVVTLTGVVAGGEQALQKAFAVIDLGLQLEAYRVLLDERSLTTSVDAHEIINVAKQVEQRDLWGYGARVACLPNPDQSDIHKVYETAYSNRSYSYRLFEDRDQAIEWLGK